MSHKGWIAGQRSVEMGGYGYCATTMAEGRDSGRVEEVAGVAGWLSGGGEYDFSEVARGSADRGGSDWGVRARKARRRRRGVGGAR